MSEVKIDEVVGAAVQNVTARKGKRGRKRKNGDSKVASTARPQYIPPEGTKWSGEITVPDEFTFPPVGYFDCPASYFASRAKYYETREVTPCRKQAEEYAALGDVGKQNEEYKRRKGLEELASVDAKKLATVKTAVENGNIDILREQLEAARKYQEELLAMLAKTQTAS